MTLEFKREEEQSRIARKASDTLQEEYCKITNSVAEERKRNLMYIERAKTEFITEIVDMSLKVAKFDRVEKSLTRIMDRQKEIQTEVMLKLDEKFVTLKTEYQEAVS